MNRPMHIPDGFLSTPVWAALDVVSVPAIGFAARRAEGVWEESRVPLLGVMGAFVFAAQMINFPVGAGTSGHLVGSSLLAITLGPAAAIIVMTAILALQALIFQDGGLLALGANVFNMGVAGVFAGYLPYLLWSSGSWRRASVFAGGLLSVMVAASLTMVELRISGLPMPMAVASVSSGLFLISGLIEGAITVAVVSSLEKMNPDWLQPAPEARRSWGALIIAAILLASVGALFASALPDGLEKLAETLGIADRSRNLVEAPVAEYELRWVDQPLMRKAAAGLLGLGMIYGICLAVGRVLARRRTV